MFVVFPPIFMAEAIITVIIRSSVKATKTC